MISVVIPFYVYGQEALDDLNKCVASLTGYDELILVGTTEEESFASKINRGIEQSTGEYVALVNNDTVLKQGSLEDMCIPGAVVRARTVHEDGTPDAAKFSFVMIDRGIFYDVGFLDERFEGGYYEDDDFLRRCEDHEVPVLDCAVEVYHKGGATMKQIGKEKYKAINKAKFEEKWSS